MPGFDIERFVDLSGAVRLDDLDWDEVARTGLTDVEAQILRYMADTESHTIVYLRDLLAGHTARDPDITSFLSVWVYEELWHGRAIDRLLAAAGRAPAPQRYTEVTERASFRETVEAALAWMAAWSTPRFIAAHMTWGAINELTAAAAYTALARTTRSTTLATLATRLAKQERKHFSFYFHQAQRRLEDDRRAQALCRFTIKSFWRIVGSGVAGEENLVVVAGKLFGDEAGQRSLAEAEASIRELPGMEWFDLLRSQVSPLLARYRADGGVALAA